MSRVEGKVAIVTGAASGLGLASSKKLIQEGARVVLTDINQQALETMFLKPLIYLVITF